MSFLKKMGYAVETLKDVSKDILSGENITCSEDESNKRLSICDGCPHFIKNLKVCNECGCMMKLKTNLQSAKCPIGKW